MVEIFQFPLRLFQHKGTVAVTEGFCHLRYGDILRLSGINPLHIVKNSCHIVKHRYGLNFSEKHIIKKI